MNHRLAEYRRKARERLTSEEGVKHRGRRCIEPEAVFGQMKYNMAYRRFRHFGMDKVKMDFAFFAIAFNLKKMCSKMAKQTWQNRPEMAEIHPNPVYFCLFFGLYAPRIENFWKIPKNRSLEYFRALNSYI